MADLPPPPPGGPVIGPTTKVPKSECPACGAPCGAATTAFGEARPSPESAVFVCIECSALVCFADDWTPRLVTAEEEAALDPANRAQITWLRQALKEFRKDTGRRPRRRLARA